MSTTDTSKAKVVPPREAAEILTRADENHGDDPGQDVALGKDRPRAAGLR